jgi:hypothetical protein
MWAIYKAVRILTMASCRLTGDYQRRRNILLCRLFKDAISIEAYVYIASNDRVLGE